MKLSFEEQETIIRWDRRNPEAIIYTYEPTLKRKLKEMEHQFPDKVKLDNEDGDSVEYIIPKELITTRKPRVLSEEAQDRLRKQGIRLAKRKRPEEDSEQHQLQAL